MFPETLEQLSFFEEGKFTDVDYANSLATLDGWRLSH
jgi:hypothetical protein